MLVVLEQGDMLEGFAGSYIGFGSQEGAVFAPMVNS
jgi:hypothetical protein